MRMSSALDAGAAAGRIGLRRKRRRLRLDVQAGRIRLAVLGDHRIQIAHAGHVTRIAAAPVFGQRLLVDEIASGIGL